MKQVFLIIALFFTLATFGQTANYPFLKDLDFVYENLKKSASYQTQREKHKTLEVKYKELKQEASTKGLNLIQSYIKLYELLDILTDNHNYIIGNTEPFSYGDLQKKDFLIGLKNNHEYNFYPKVNLDLDSLEKTLLPKNINDLEGIYHYENYFKIAIYKSQDSLYQGVILETKISSWERGETILYLLPKGNNRFRVFTGRFIDKKLISSTDYFKNGTFKTFDWKKVNIKSDFYNVGYPKERFVFKRLNNSYSYIKLSTFNSSNEGIKQATEFCNQVTDSLNSPNLIVDLRNNGGGGDKSSEQFFKLFKRYKGNIFILTNYYTGSNAEQFTIKMKSLKNITILGDRTFGIITYGHNYNEDFETPSKRFRIHFTDLKDNWRKYLKFENIGIEPDIYLDTNSDWIEQIMKRYN